MIPPPPTFSNALSRPSIRQLLDLVLSLVTSRPLSPSTHQPTRSSSNSHGATTHHRHHHLPRRDSRPLPAHPPHPELVRPVITTPKILRLSRRQPRRRRRLRPNRTGKRNILPKRSPSTTPRKTAGLSYVELHSVLSSTHTHPLLAVESMN